MVSHMPNLPVNAPLWAVCILIVTLAGCSFAPSQPPPPPPSQAQIAQDATQKRLDATDKAAAQQYRRLNQRAMQSAYAAGVKDTMEEFKMRMDGRQDFVYQPPIIDYVKVPARVSNGAFIPAHSEPVIVSPGRWIEENSVMLPDPSKLKGGNKGSGAGQP